MPGIARRTKILTHSMPHRAVIQQQNPVTVGQFIPNGVTFFPNDGELVTNPLDPTTVTNNFYGRSGLTAATNTSYAKSWDDPTYFPVGVWESPLGSAAQGAHLPSDWYVLLGWTVAFGPDGGFLESEASRNAIWVFIRCGGVYPPTDYSFFTPPGGSDIVGLNTNDEPGNYSDYAPAITTAPDSFCGGRILWLNNLHFFFTDSPVLNGTGPSSPTPSATGVWQGTQNTASGTPRTLSLGSIDQYWCSCGETSNAIVGQGGQMYLAIDPTNASQTINLTQDQCRRAGLYGDLVRTNRNQVKNGGTEAAIPSFVYVETGGPYTNQGTLATYITPLELNQACWAGVIAGARGVIFFDHTMSGPAISNNNCMGVSFYTTIQVNNASFTGTGSGTTLTVTSVTGTVRPGDTLSGTGVPANTKIVAQLSGTPNGAGTYQTNNATTSSGAALTTGMSIYDQVTATTLAIGTTYAPLLNSPNVTNFLTNVSPAGITQTGIPIPPYIGPTTSTISTGSTSFTVGSVPSWVRNGLLIADAPGGGGKIGPNTAITSIVGNTINFSPAATIFAGPIAAGSFIGIQGIDAFNDGIDTAVKYYNHKFHILACTRASEASSNITATFTIRNCGGTVVTVVGENRTLTLSNIGGNLQQFTDIFATAYDVHIYRID